VASVINSAAGGREAGGQIILQRRLRQALEFQDDPAKALRKAEPKMHPK